MDDIDFESLEEELAKIDPAELRNLLQLLSENVSVVEKIIQNVLEEPISEETQKRLQPRLRPKPFQPIAPPRISNKRQELRRRFDPFPPQNIRNLTDYQNEILNLYNVARFEGEESKLRRYIRWRFTQNLNEDHTPKFMEKIRQNVRTLFYVRHVYAYRLQHIEDGTIIIFYTNQGSPWINTIAKAEKWLKEREAERLDPDNTSRPNSKWVFLDHFSLDLKVVLDGYRTLTRLAAQPCTRSARASNGGAGYLSR